MPRPTATDMSRRWDRLAERDSLHYIATRRRGWDEDEFFASGRAAAERAISWIGDGAGRGRALDLGCGVGRITRHFAARFDRVDGVDVSPAMIEQARSYGPPENVELHVGSGADLAGLPSRAYDLVYSALVFQHIPDEGAIDRYLAEIARVLAPAGRAVVQFDTRRDRGVLRWYKALPDAILPRAHRRFIRRYRRDPDRLRNRMRDAGLEVLDERSPRSAYHYFLLRAAGGAAGDDA